MNPAVESSVFDGEGMAMKWRPMQLELEVEANHRALRRCHGCGAYARVEEVEGLPRCERCASKVKREKDGAEPEDLNATV
jgi:rRNA maturation endonuclease Nob1